MTQEQYQIQVLGHLGPQGNEWFEGLVITNTADGHAILCGALTDQAALHGVLMKIRDLGLPLLAVSRVTGDETRCQAPERESVQ
jgi:hypothetical protein